MLSPWLAANKEVWRIIRNRVVGKAKRQLQQELRPIYAEVICGYFAQALLAFRPTTQEASFFAFSDLCHEQRLPDQQSHKL
jgi:hypothetical protein